MNTLFHSFIYSLVLVFIFSASHADTLGRLFTTPQERAALDSKSGIKLANRGLDKNEASQQIKLNGTVISSTGKRNFWINGKKHENNNPDELHLYLTNSRQVQIDTLNGSQSNIIKPGQVLNLNNGKIYESFTLDKTQPDKDRNVETIQ